MRWSPPRLLGGTALLAAVLAFGAVFWRPMPAGESRGSSGGQSPLVVATPTPSPALSAAPTLRTRRASGTVRAARMAELFFDVGPTFRGRVREIRVSEGENVQAGAVLAAVDASQLRLAERQAAAAYEATVAALEKARHPFDERDRARGEAAAELAWRNLQDARRNLASLEDSPLTRKGIDDLGDLFNWFQVRTGRERERWEQGAITQESYLKSLKNLQNVGDLLQAAKLSATFGLEVARREVAAAEAALRQAEAHREKVFRGGDPRQIRLREAEAQRAALAWEEARQRLEGATLRAPFPGVVGRIDSRVHDLVDSSATVLTLFDPASLEVSATISELSAPLVVPGAAATVRVDGLPGREYRGRIVEKASVPEQGAPAYHVKVALEAPPQAGLLPGMSASLEFALPSPPGPAASFWGGSPGRKLVEAPGTVVAARIVPLSFNVGASRARLWEVKVSEGQGVQAGDLLASLDPTDFQGEVGRARAAVAAAEAALDLAIQPFDAADIAQAEAVLQRAEVALEQAQLGSLLARHSDLVGRNLRDLEELRREAQRRAAEAEKKFAEGGVSEQTFLERADEAAKLQREVEDLRRRGEVSIAAADTALERTRQAVVEAQDLLTKMRRGGDEQDIRLRQAELQRTQAALALAEQLLEETRLRAPFGGVVARVHASEGERVGTGTPVVTLLDPSQLTVEAQVAEVDIAQVRTGQEVQVTLEALPELRLSAQVTEKAALPTTRGGPVTYRVTALLTLPVEPRVLSGMSARVFFPAGG